MHGQRTDQRHKPLSLIKAYRRAANELARGGVVALPTDTVFGLCALARDDGAVDRIYDVKGRAPDQALPLFVGSVEQACLITEWNVAAAALAEALWPGALTLVLRRSPAFDTRAAAGGGTIGVRVPDDAAIREIASQIGPLTATSANRSGAPECRSADEVRRQLGDSVDFIVDAPVQTNARPSTVVDCADANTVRILRAGEVTRERIERALAAGGWRGTVADG